LVFRGYESCTRCLATARLKHTYVLRYFGPLGRMPHFTQLILFLIQSGKRGKWNYAIQGKIVMPEHTYTHFYIDNNSNNNNNNNNNNLIQLNSLLFMCRVKSRKANYRQHSLDTST
jgi:hypothetical protein